MGKNLTGGNKAKSMSRSKASGKKQIFREPNYAFGEIVAKVTKELGDARFLTLAFDYTKNVFMEINCSAPKKIRIRTNDIVLINIIRDNKRTEAVLGCVIYKYMPENIEELKEHDSLIIKEFRYKRLNIITLLKYETKDKAKIDKDYCFDDDEDIDIIKMTSFSAATASSSKADDAWFADISDI